MRLASLVVILLSGYHVFSQSTANALRPGERVPEISFTVGGSKKVSISDFKGRVVVLFFWRSNCTGCIQQFPLLDSLQESLKDKLKIILVDPIILKNVKDDSLAVRRIMNAYKKRTGKELELSSSINEDTVAVKYFPYKSISHVVWIDRDGVYKGATAKVTRMDVKLMLDSGRVASSFKDDFYSDLASERMFSTDTSGIKFKSIFTAYLPGISNQFKSDHARGLHLVYLQGVRFINDFPRDIILPTWEFYGNENEIITEGIDRSNFAITDVQSNDSLWQQKYLYCYELISPGFSKAQIIHQVKLDVSRALQIQVYKEKRMMDCWIIKMDERQRERIRSKNKSAKNLLTLQGVTGYFPALDYPVLAEIDNDEKIFSYNPPDDDSLLVDLQQWVKENRLSLVKEKRAREVLVIKKAPGD